MAKRNVKSHQLLTRRRDDSSVCNNQNGLLILLLKMLLDESTNLSEGGVGSVGDSNEEVLGSGAVGLLVVNSMDAVNKDDLQMCLESLVVELQLEEGFGDFFLQHVGNIHEINVFIQDVISLQC